MPARSQPHDRRIHADALRQQYRKSQWSRFTRQAGIMASSVALGAAAVPYIMLDQDRTDDIAAYATAKVKLAATRSAEHTSELQSLMRISYAVFCLTKKHQTT